MDIEPVQLWNSTLCEVIDHCEEIGVQLSDNGKDSEALAGIELAERVIRLQTDRKALLDALKGFVSITEGCGAVKLTAIAAIAQAEKED